MGRCTCRLFVYAAILLFAGLPDGEARAEKRFALVIGNGAYATSPLKNPVNDAQDMATALRGVGLKSFTRKMQLAARCVRRSASSADKSGKAG